ncbi:MAG: alpha/beta hydrolase [Anaerolineae bacterium]|nr:alpha/beta hydrolase [Anaerolineae bacterium]NUQ04604.1 alpha/beta fold hydrolase [Anaerolineae bacterium]
MRRYFTRLVGLNGIFCAIFGGLFALPLGRPEIGLAAGLGFGIVVGLLVEAIFWRWRGRWLYRRRLLALVLTEALLLLYVLLPGFIAYLNLRPARFPVTAIPAELADRAEVVSVTTRDGVSLSGWYIPPQNGAVLIALHGFGDNRLGVLPHARMLTARGYGVLMMDMRAHGSSGGEIYADGWNTAGDVGALAAYLQTRPEVEHIGALGLSAGAVAILRGGAANDAIEAFIADGTGVGAIEDVFDPLLPHPAIAWLLVPDYWMSYRFTALFSGETLAPPLREQVKRIAPRPILFIAGAESMWEPELAARYVLSAGDSAEAWVIPNTGHIAGILTHPDAYAGRVYTFLEHWLAGRSP